ncbi:hypothetical protein KR059_008067 [Drosophila kikkawai]|nr:hypothetical protein KR059_008067 [Drosophila kikkawai]
MLTFGEIYHGYGLLIGMTSYRLTNGRFQQSWITQAYAVILNVVLICTLPFVFWDIATELMKSPWLPGKMYIVPFILHMVNYAVVAYILVSRCQRDSLVIDLADLTDRLTRKMERAELTSNPQLRRLLLLKSFTSAYLSFVPMASVLFIKSGFLMSCLVNLSYSILNLTSYFYFASVWQIARGYDFVNQQLCPGRALEGEIKNLWSLHLLFGRMAHRINRIYGVQMLVCRLDYIVSSIIYGYVGLIFMFKGITPLAVHAALILVVRTVDVFLDEFICELSLRYQCQPMDEVSEGKMSQELGDFLIYKSSLRLNLKICGLYSANRNQWLQMMGFIISSSTLLMQFYLILREDYENN